MQRMRFGIEIVLHAPVASIQFLMDSAMGFRCKTGHIEKQIVIRNSFSPNTPLLAVFDYFLNVLFFFVFVVVLYLFYCVYRFL